MYIKKEVYNKILFDTPKLPPESGGILGGYDGKVTLFVSDKGKSLSSSYKYEPNTELLNTTINNWLNNDVEFMGIYHSHPKNCEKLSVADIEYINQVMRSVSDYTDKLYFPLVIPKEKIISFYGLIVADEIKIFQDVIQLI